MNTTQKTIMADYNSDYVLDSDMANLLRMTNQVLLKIKQQTRGQSLWILVKFAQNLSVWVTRNVAQLIVIWKYFNSGWMIALETILVTCNFWVLWSKLSMTLSCLIHGYLEQTIPIITNDWKKIHNIGINPAYYWKEGNQKGIWDDIAWFSWRWIHWI